MTIKLFKYSQVANALDVDQATINVWVGRENMKACIVDGKKMIDVSDPTNKLWLKKQEEDGKEFDLNRAFKKPSEVKRKPKAPRVPQVNQLTIEEKEERSDLQKVQLEIKQANLERVKKGIELDEIKIQKQLGQLLPTDAVKSFFLFVVESFTKSYEQEAKTIANLLLSRFGANSEDQIETQKDLSKKIAEIKNDSVEQLHKGLDQIVEEYQETRSRGESK